MERKLSLMIQFLAADKLSGSMRRIIGLGDSGATKLAKMKREARDLDNQLKSVRNDMAGASGNITQLANRERDLEAAIAAANRQAERQKRLLAIDNKVTKVKAQGEAYKAAGRENMMTGAGIMAPFVLGASGAMQFSSGMVDLQQKAELTNAEMVKMQGQILATARATHQLPSAMRDAVDVLASAGLDPRIAVKLAGPIGRLGTAFKVDLADGANAAYANLNNLKVPLADVGKAFDIMASGGNMGRFEIADMAKQFPTLTARMQALGQVGVPAVADLTAALQMAMNTAGNADEAGNNINNLLSKINSPAVIKAFEKNFGVNLPAAMDKFQAKGMTAMEAFAQITKDTLGGKEIDGLSAAMKKYQAQGLSAAEAFNMAANSAVGKKLGFVIEDQQAQMGLLGLIQNMDAYRKMRADIMKSAGTVDRAFGQRELQDGMIAWSAFRANAEATSLVLGGKLLPVATQFLGIVGGMAGAVGDWAQAHPQATTALLTMVAGLGAARIGLGALQFAFGGLLGPMATAWGWWKKYKELGTIAEAFPRLAKGFGIVRTAAMFMAKGVMRAGMLMLANPMVLAIVAIVAALAAAGYLIWRHWDTIKGAFNGAVGWLGQAWQSIKAKVMAFPAAFGPIGLIAGFVMRNWGAIKAGFASGIGMIGQAWDGIKSGVTAGLTWFANLNVRMLQIGAQIVQGLVRGIQAAPGAVWNALKSIVFRGVEGIKAYLGIKSPSRLFMGLGGFMTEGLERGIDRGGRHPLRAMSRLAAGVAAAMAVPTVAPAGIVPIDRPEPPRIPVLAPLAFSILDPEAPRMPAMAVPSARAVIDAPTVPPMPALAAMDPLPLAIASPAAPSMPALPDLRGGSTIDAPALPTMPRLGALSARVTIAPPEAPRLPALGALPLSIAGPAAPAMPALPQLSALPLSIADPAAPRMPAFAAQSIRAAIASPAAPAMPALPQLGALPLSVADPAAPRMPSLAAQTIRAAIANPAAPDLPTLGALRFSSAIDAPAMPKLAALDPLRIGIDIDDPALPRLPALEWAIATRQDPADPSAPGRATAPREMVRPMARMAPAARAPAPAQTPPLPRRDGDSYHFHIQQRPGEDTDALAKRIAEEIKRKKRRDDLGEYDDE